MPNILLTTGCNLSCDYCFAQEKMIGRRRHMSMANLAKVIDFLKRSKFMLFRAMGGEPTLHPRFIEIVGLALREGMRVDLLSNATWNDECGEFLARVPPGRLCYLLNIDHPDRYTSRKWARIERNLAALPERGNVTLSFNLFEREPRYQYILDLTAKYGIGMIRLSFSLPVLGAQNSFLQLEDYRDMAPVLMEIVRQAAAAGVSVQLDNAVPLCMFTAAQAGQLLLDGVLDLKRNGRCDPIIDIGPDLDVWCCFCLSKLYNRTLDEFESLAEVEDYYRTVLRRYQSMLVPMDDCQDCRYHELWACQGGCLTYSLMKESARYPNALLPENDDASLERDSRLSLCEDVLIKRYEIPSDCYVLSSAASGIEVEIEATVFHPLGELLDGSHTVAEVFEGCIANEYLHRSPADAFLRQVHEESLNDLLLGLIEKGILTQSSPQHHGSASSSRR